ncbi:MAG: hypothetical protein K2X69_05550, partial [Silvanigrellaceae bacterium]|nr:hypothetical protein [Silvanigrellaceae bacterium]
EVPVKSWLDEIEIKPYESKEMIANKEKEKLDKLSNLESDIQKSQMQEFSTSLKLLIDSAVKIYLKKPIDIDNLNLIAKEILEKFGASKSIKSKINDVLYALFINEKTKLIHVNYDSIEFTINFPKINIENIDTRSNHDLGNKNKVETKKQNQTEGAKEGGAGSSNMGGIGIKNQNQDLKENNKDEIILKEQNKEENEIQFHSIPIYFTSPLKDTPELDCKENNESKEITVQ